MPPWESLRSSRYFPAMITPLCSSRLPDAARITPERSPRGGSGGLPCRAAGRSVGGGLVGDSFIEISVERERARSPLREWGIVAPRYECQRRFSETLAPRGAFSARLRALRAE